MNKSKSNYAILKTLGVRFKQNRLSQNISQAELAKKAGVSALSIAHIEVGTSTSMKTFLAAIRALGKIRNLDLLLPEPPVSPILLKKLKGKTKKRASKVKK
jgi:Predicted transcriptional regulator with C-terminal CBS domains